MPSAIKTRSKKGATKSKEEEPTESTSTTRKLETSVSNPPQVFILPKETNKSARIITLPNPATSNPNRYLICPDHGFYEFTCIAAPKKACRSWLLASDRKDATPQEQTSNQEDGEGYVLQTPDMMVATQIDPLFLLLPALAGATGNEASNGRSEQEYLSPSDYVERLADRSAHLKQFMQSDARSQVETGFETRMHAVCDSMDAGDERLYTLSKQKLLAEMVAKAKRMVKQGLPVSMEERFVKRELVVPVLGVKREESSVSITKSEEPSNGGAESQSASESTSQETESSTTTSVSASTAATSVVSTPSNETTTISDEITHLLRLRTALNFLFNSYIPAALRSSLENLMKSSPSIVDFTPLEKHIAHINELKKEAQALRSMSDNISRKRSAIEDEEALEKAEAKKRKKEEEEIKKKNTSRGVQQLKKADTSGMKKLSSFFTAKPAAKKS